MSYPKRPLQDAEETLGFAVQLIEVDRLRHEGVSAGLQDFLFVFVIPADRDDGGLVFGVCLDAPANLDSIYTGNHDIQNQEVRFDAANVNQSGDAIGCG